MNNLNIQRTLTVLSLRTMFKVTFTCLILLSSFQIKAKVNPKTIRPVSSVYNPDDPEVKAVFEKYGIEAAVNYTLNKDCKRGSRLTCAVLKYRKQPSRKNLRKVSKELKKFPCRKSQIGNCTYHLFARIYTNKFQKALELARKLCKHGHDYSCRQITFYKLMGEFEMKNSKF